jgi:hypothetical protein
VTSMLWATMGATMGATTGVAGGGGGVCCAGRRGAAVRRRRVQARRVRDLVIGFRAGVSWGLLR